MTKPVAFVLSFIFANVLLAILFVCLLSEHLRLSKQFHALTQNAATESPRFYELCTVTETYVYSTSVIWACVLAVAFYYFICFVMFKTMRDQSREKKCNQATGNGDTGPRCVDAGVNISQRKKRKNIKINDVFALCLYFFTATFPFFYFLFFIVVDILLLVSRCDTNSCLARIIDNKTVISWLLFGIWLPMIFLVLWRIRNRHLIVDNCHSLGYAGETENDVPNNQNGVKSDDHFDENASKGSGTCQTNAGQSTC
ncbi:MAG: hypothetical protein ACRC46_06320 [Thermoguttaceae bacterium]